MFYRVLTRPSQREFVGRAGFGNHAACACGGAVFHGYGRNNHRSRTNANIVANLGMMFVYAIIIAGNRACADIAAFANGGIADIA